MPATMTSSPILRHDNRLAHLHRYSQVKYTHLIYTRDMLVSQDPNADADRAWEMIESLVKLSQSLPFYDPVQQALKFYDSIRARMEAQYQGQYIAIHPETQNYAVERRPGKAFRALRTMQPSGSIIVHNIGAANSGLKARLRGEQPR